MKYKYIGTEEQLVERGYHKSHVAVFPTAMTKIIDDKHVIEVCMEEPSYNMWDGRDWKQSKIFELWQCSVVKKSNNKILLEPNVKEHWYYEKKQYGIEDITPYIQDLIDDGLVEVVE